MKTKTIFAIALVAVLLNVLAGEYLLALALFVLMQVTRLLLNMEDSKRNFNKSLRP